METRGQREGGGGGERGEKVRGGRGRGKVGEGVRENKNDSLNHKGMGIRREVHKKAWKEGDIRDVT